MDGREALKLMLDGKIVRTNENETRVYRINEENQVQYCDDNNWKYSSVTINDFLNCFCDWILVE